MNLGGFLGVLDALAPARLAEPWDNIGVMTGRRDMPVTRVLVALDLRAGVLDEAIESGADLVLVHHPPIFPALSPVSPQRTQGALVLRAAAEGVAVVAAHTNLDSAAGGLNDLMAAGLGMRDLQPLAPCDADPALGIGRVGTIDAMPLGGLSRRAVDAFCTRRANVGMTGDPDRRVSRVAVCTGSGGSLVEAARQAGADAYVTGDLRYHDHDAAEGMGLVNVAHGAVEQHVMRQWAPALAHALAPSSVPVVFTEVDTDPWLEAC